MTRDPERFSRLIVLLNVYGKIFRSAAFSVTRRRCRQGRRGEAKCHGGQPDFTSYTHRSAPFVKRDGKPVAA
jgi:hypothetical protein